MDAHLSRINNHLSSAVRGGVSLSLLSLLIVATLVPAFFYDACTAADQQGISFTPAHPGPQDSKHSRGVEGD